MNERLTSYVFVAPTVLVFIAVIALPTVMGFCYSFTDWTALKDEICFVGMDNFKRLLGDDVFIVAIRNTLLITLAVVVFQNMFAFILASLLAGEGSKGKNICRVLFFLPSLLSIIIVGYMWLYILNVHGSTAGTFGYLLRHLGIKDVARYDLFIKPMSALAVVSFSLVWQYGGYNMVIYIAGMKAIPKELYESCDIEGVGILGRFFGVTLPLLVPSITVCVFLNLIGSLKTFEIVYVMTRGGPGNSTETIGTFVYNSAVSTNQLGYAAAISAVLFLGILVISTIQVKVLRSKEVEL